MRRTGIHLGDVAAAGGLLAALIAVTALLEPPATTSRTVRVIDGDTLEMAGRRVRLRGMDAPEIAQTCLRAGAVVRCGEEAREALAGLVRDREVACRASGLDRYGRELAVCRAGAIDIGGALVRRGLAVAYGGYQAEERAARAERVGLWAGSFERPADYRKLHPRGPQSLLGKRAPPHIPGADCACVPAEAG